MVHESLVLRSKLGSAKKSTRRRRRPTPREGMKTILCPPLEIPEAISRDFVLRDIYTTTFRIIQGVRMHSRGTDRRIHRVSIRTEYSTCVVCSTTTRAQSHQGDSFVFTKTLVHCSSKLSTHCPALRRRCGLPNVACPWPQALLFSAASCITASCTNRLLPSVSCGPPLAVKLGCSRWVSGGSSRTL